MQSFREGYGLKQETVSYILEIACAGIQEFFTSFNMAK